MKLLKGNKRTNLDGIFLGKQREREAEGKKNNATGRGMGKRKEKIMRDQQITTTIGEKTVERE